MSMVLEDLTMSIKIPDQIENILINIHNIQTHTTTAVATKIRPYIYRVNNLKIIHLKK